MKKEELRKIKAKIEITKWDKVTGIGQQSMEERNGYFHTWIKETYSEDDGLHVYNYALIEFEDGKMKNVDPEKIQFVDEF